MRTIGAGAAGAMPRGREDGQSAQTWRTDLRTIARLDESAASPASVAAFADRSAATGPGTARKGLKRGIPAALAILLMISFPIYAGSRLAHYWETPIGTPEDPVKPDWRDTPVGANLNLPHRLERYAETDRAGERVVLRLTLQDLLDTVPRARYGAFPENLLDERVIVTLSRPDGTLFSLRGFQRTHDARLSDTIRVGANGLTEQPFREPGQYLGESLFFETGYARDRFFAHCKRVDDMGSAGSCSRPLRISSRVGLTYTFPSILLNEWPRLEAAMLALGWKVMEPR